MSRIGGSVSRDITCRRRHGSLYYGALRPECRAVSQGSGAGAVAKGQLQLLAADSIYGGDLTITAPAQHRIPGDDPAPAFQGMSKTPITEIITVGSNASRMPFGPIGPRLSPVCFGPNTASTFGGCLGTRAFLCCNRRSAGRHSGRSITITTLPTALGQTYT